MFRSVVSVTYLTLLLQDCSTSEHVCLSGRRSLPSSRPGRRRQCFHNIRRSSAQDIIHSKRSLPISKRYQHQGVQWPPDPSTFLLRGSSHLQVLRMVRTELSVRVLEVEMCPSHGTICQQGRPPSLRACILPRMSQRGTSHPIRRLRTVHRDPATARSALELKQRDLRVRIEERR